MVLKSNAVSCIEFKILNHFLLTNLSVVSTTFFWMRRRRREATSRDLNLVIKTQKLEQLEIISQT